jgi:hypothetical protein
MPDEIDLAQEREHIATAEAIRQAAREIPPGEPGDCDLCGEWTARLINGACAPCRDKYGLP